MALKIYKYEKLFTNFKQKMLRVGIIKHSSFDSMMKNLNTTTTNADNSKASRCADQTMFDW